MPLDPPPEEAAGAAEAFAVHAPPIHICPLPPAGGDGAAAGAAAAGAAAGVAGTAVAAGAAAAAAGAGGAAAAAGEAACFGVIFAHPMPIAHEASLTA